MEKYGSVFLDCQEPLADTNAFNMFRRDEKGDGAGRSGLTKLGIEAYPVELGEGRFRVEVSRVGEAETLAQAKVVAEKLQAFFAKVEVVNA